MFASGGCRAGVGGQAVTEVQEECKKPGRLPTWARRQLIAGNGRLEHLRGSALGLRNLTNYIARSVLEAGGFRPLLHL